MYSVEYDDDVFCRQESRKANCNTSPESFIDPNRLGDDWGWFSDPLLEIPVPIYDSIAHARGEQNGRREMRRAGR